MDMRIYERKKAFTILELLVAVSVTALLAGMLLTITSQGHTNTNQGVRKLRN